MSIVKALLQDGHPLRLGRRGGAEPRDALGGEEPAAGDLREPDGLEPMTFKSFLESIVIRIDI